MKIDNYFCAMHLTPTKLRELCKQYGLTPSKKYGQNFLIQEWPIKKMLEAAKVSKDDTVIEIGPGFGILTFALASAAGKVVAFEIERKLEGYWDEQIETKKLGNLEIIYGNALTELKVHKVHKVYKVIANLPYQITSNVLRTLLELGNKPESITVMVQKEVAERICAKPRSAGSRQAGDMSLLAVSVQYYGEPKIVDIVTRGNFWPEPGVDSAILNIEIKPSSRAQAGGKLRNLEISDSEFFRVVKAGFANKRKQAWKNISTQLKVESYKVKSVIGEVVGDEKARAEELSVNNWLDIVKKIGN